MTWTKEKHEAGRAYALAHANLMRCDWCGFLFDPAGAGCKPDDCSMRPLPRIDTVRRLARRLSEALDEIERLQGDGHGFSTASLPLPADHWIYKEQFAPPMPMRMGTDDPRREDLVRMLRDAGKYAVRASTMCGREMDFDPDAMLQNLIVGMLGYWTPSGLSADPECNPPDES